MEGFQESTTALPVTVPTLSPVGVLTTPSPVGPLAVAVGLVLVLLVGLGLTVGLAVGLTVGLVLGLVLGLAEALAEVLGEAEALAVGPAGPVRLRSSAR